MEAAAPPTPSAPNGANGWKFAIFTTGSDSAMKSTNAATLMHTKIAFTVALSRVPSTRRPVTSVAIPTAGKLIKPPAK